jgi:hypothetical protein
MCRNSAFPDAFLGPEFRLDFGARIQARFRPQKSALKPPFSTPIFFPDF